MPSQKFRYCLIIGGVLALALLFDLWPWLRGPEQWRWPLALFPPWPRLLVSGAAALLFLGGWWGLRQRAVHTPHLALAGLYSLGLLLQFSLLNLIPTTSGQYNPLALLFERLASAQASGYFTAAQEINHLPTALREYPQLMPTFTADPHPRSKPPGIVLLYYGSEQLLARLPTLSDPLGHWARGIRCADFWLVSRSNAALAANLLVALFTPLLSGLAIWPAYGLGRRLYGAEAGWLAAGLVLLMPGRLAFAPHLDTVYPLLTLLALYLAERAVRQEKWGYGIASGVCMSLATYFSLVNALIAPVVGLFVLVRLAQDRIDFWPRLLRHGAAISLGTISVWLLYGVVSGVTPWAIYDAAAPARHDLERDYWVWLPGNGYDFALFAGLPLFLLAWPRLAELRQWRQIDGLLVGFWLTFILLLLSGMIRGEVGRIWLLLAPAPLLLAVRGWPRQTRWEGMGLLVVVAAASWVINSRWQLTQLEWPLESPRPVILAEPTPDYPLNATLDEEIRLRGYDLAIEDTLQLTLYWQTGQRPEIPYTVFIHLLDEQGEIATQRDVMPQDGRLPTSCWQPGETVHDSHELELRPLPTGTYTLVVGLYEQSSGLRLGEPVTLTTISKRHPNENDNL